MSTKYHVKTGDNVVLIAGDEKGKSGKIIQVLPKKDRVIVEGLNPDQKTYPNGVSSIQRERSWNEKVPFMFQMS